MSCRGPRPARRGRSVASRALRPAVVFLSTLAASSALAREPMALVRNGRATGVIVATAADTGAVELQDYLRKITGAAVPIVSAPARGRAAVRVGVYGHPPVESWSGAAPPADGFVIAPRGRTLFIVGGDTRGALYGVYDLLETDLGVRWFMPGELGEDVVRRDTVLLPTHERHGQPAFQAVGGFIWSGGPGAAAWEKHVRADVGPAGSFFGHNWANIIPPTADNMAAHPDWFALSGGKRTRQLCSGHPNVVHATVVRAREFFDSHPDALTFSVSPNDGYGFCEDERCRSIDRLYGIADGSLTDRLVYYANEVLTGLAQTHPDKQVGLLAYLSYVQPPRAVRPLPNFATLVTRMPWEFCHVHALDDPSCDINRRFVEYVKGWRRVCGHVGVYDYYGHFDAFTPWPIVHSIRRDLRLLRRLGVERFMSETQQHWANQGLNFYVGAKLAWNPDQDVDALLDDYFTRFYGRAAAPMRRYWMGWEDAMATQPHGDDHWQTMFTAVRIAEADAALTDAEQAAATDRPKVAQRVALARAGFRFTEAWARLRGHAQRGEWRAAISAGEEAIACAQDTVGSEPQAFVVPLVIRQTEARLAPYRVELARAETQ
jgi:hypothetical protein